MTSRTLCITIAVACFALLSQVAVNAQATVYVDSGAAATNYEGTGVTAGTSGGVAQIVVTPDNSLTHAVIVTAPGVAGEAWTSVEGGLSAVSSNGNSSLFVDDAGSFLGTDTSGLTIADSGTSATLLVESGESMISHGLDINETRTILSGGTDSTTLTLDDFGATFQDSLGGPARVHGVADGIAPFDAVNRRQLDSVETAISSGIASIAALAAIPGPVGCKMYSIGLGYGHFGGQNAGAVGLKANLPKSNVSLAVGGGFSENASPAYNAGISLSF